MNTVELRLAGNAIALALEELRQTIAKLTDEGWQAQAKSNLLRTESDLVLVLGNARGQLQKLEEFEKMGAGGGPHLGLA